MLKRIKDYIPTFKDSFYINEFGDVYREIVLKKSSNGSYDAKIEIDGKTLHLGRDLQEFLRQEFDIHLCQYYKRHKCDYVFDGEYYRINSKVVVLYKDCKFFVEWNVKPQSNGYSYICSNKKHYTIHELVYKCFVGSLREGHIVHHLNRNKQFNYYKNLKQLSRAEHINEHRDEIQ